MIVHLLCVAAVTSSHRHRCGVRPFRRLRFRSCNQTDEPTGTTEPRTLKSQGCRARRLKRFAVRS